jgi:hypothetical protein
MVMKIYDQLFVGIKYRSNEPPLGFAVPYDDTEASRKREATVTSWLDDWQAREALKQGGKPSETRIIPNQPLDGFVLTDDIRRTYWGGGNVVWRVADPRGFELEISSANLMSLIRTVTIGAGGDISGQCVWARDGARNILLPTSTDEYRQGVKGFNEKVSVRPAPGQRCVRRDGTEVVYLGRWHALPLESWEASNTAVAGLPGGKTTVVYARTASTNINYVLSDVMLTSKGEVEIYSKATFIELREPDVLTPDQIDAFLGCRRGVSWGGRSFYGFGLTYLAKKPVPVRFTTRKLTTEDKQLVRTTANKGSTYSITGTYQSNVLYKTSSAAGACWAQLDDFRINGQAYGAPLYWEGDEGRQLRTWSQCNYDVQSARPSSVTLLELPTFSTVELARAWLDEALDNGTLHSLWLAPL